MNNPFFSGNDSCETDESLIKSALGGNKKSLEELILRHQSWIYNIALRMVFYPAEAEDVTQEILIKMITKLSTFRFESSFRTWLYRIVTNHVLNMKKSLGERRHAENFDDYWNAIERTPDNELPVQSAYQTDMRVIVNEVRVSCMSGMLLCLDREQRLVYILSAIFEVTDKVGAEMTGLSRDNFRQKLSRARKQIYNFMNSKCGLIDKRNPCRCERKTKALIDCGYVNPNKILFNINYVHSVESKSGEKLAEFQYLYDSKCTKLFRENPFQDAPDFLGSLKNILESREFKNIFNFNN